MPRFEQEWDGDVRIAYVYEDDDSLRYSIVFPGPITAEMTQDENEIPWSVIRGDRIFVYSKQETFENERSIAKGWLMHFAEHAGATYEELMDWATDPQIREITFGDPEGPALFDIGYFVEDFWRHVETVAGRSIVAEERASKSYRCAC